MILRGRESITELSGTDRRNSRCDNFASASCVSGDERETGYNNSEPNERYAGGKVPKHVYRHRWENSRRTNNHPF